LPLHGLDKPTRCDQRHNRGKYFHIFHSRPLLLVEEATRFD
jgi:hypothetical protein